MRLLGSLQMLCVRAAADFSACDLGFGAWHCIPNDILTERAGVKPLVRKPSRKGVIPYGLAAKPPRSDGH